MSFALFYDDADLLAISVQVARLDLSSASLVEAKKFWDGGLKDFQIAPGAPYDRLEGDALTNALAINAQGGLAGFVSLLRAIASQFPNDAHAIYMNAIADDIQSGTFGDNSAAKEPWTGV